ncbi:MAG: riboflavin synthase [Candidatus Eisenbacteria bacterium]|nr:riboflavin synthase [Candidatus Eisenbacteria bacterium]
MFTGIVEAVGRVSAVRRSRAGATLRVAAPFDPPPPRGESVSVSGVCLTVTSSDARGFHADVVARTLGNTTLGRLSRGARVNLERAVRAGEPLGGHIVSGHVDGTAVVRSVRPVGRGRDVLIELPRALTPQVVERGSISVDGVSLTVAAVAGNLVTVSLIPETLRATVAGAYRRGTVVNVETDILAKHAAARATGPEGPDTPPGGITLERLRELGYVKERR